MIIIDNRLQYLIYKLLKLPEDFFYMHLELLKDVLHDVILDQQ